MTKYNVEKMYYSLRKICIKDLLLETSQFIIF